MNNQWRGKYPVDFKQETDNVQKEMHYKSNS